MMIIYFRPDCINSLLKKWYFYQSLALRIWILIYRKISRNKILLHLNSFLSKLSIFKLYIIFRTYALFSKWTNEDNLPVCNKYDISTVLSFHYVQHLNRIQFFLIMLYLLLILNFFEIGVFIGNVDDGFLKYTESIGTSYWIIAKTCITLGYGEVSPKSIIARIICIISVFFGWFFSLSLCWYCSLE